MKMEKVKASQISGMYLLPTHTHIHTPHTVTHTLHTYYTHALTYTPHTQRSSVYQKHVRKFETNRYSSQSQMPEDLQYMLIIQICINKSELVFKLDSVNSL